MTKRQCMNKIRSCQKDIRAYLIRESERLLNSSAIDIQQYENDFLLPKIILTVATKNLVWQHSPLSKEGKQEVENLLNF